MIWTGWHKSRQGWVAISEGESHREATEGLRKAGVPLCDAAVMIRGAHPENLDYLSDCSCRHSKKDRQDRLEKAKALIPFLDVPISVHALAKATGGTTAQIKSELGILQRAGLVSRQKGDLGILWVAAAGIETPTPLSEKTVGHCRKTPVKWPPGLQLNFFGDPWHPPFKRLRHRRLHCL